jgi:hypothetical protein
MRTEHETEKMRKEVVMSKLKILSRRFPGGIERAMKMLV